MVLMATKRTLDEPCGMGASAPVVPGVSGIFGGHCSGYGGGIYTSRVVSG